MCRLDSILKGSDFNTAPEVDLRKFISFIFTLHGHQQRSNDCINPPNGKMVIQNYAHTEYDINSQELKVFSRHPFNKNGLKIVGAVSVIFVQPIGIGKKILVSSYLVRLERNNICYLNLVYNTNKIYKIFHFNMQSQRWQSGHKIGTLIQLSWH